MALKTDDEDIRDVRMWVEVGGNGDYYINLMEMQKRFLNQASRRMDKIDTRINMRISMSGGNAPHEVKLAAAELYRAMEKAGLNKHPKEEK